MKQFGKLYFNTCMLRIPCTPTYRNHFCLHPLRNSTLTDWICILEKHVREQAGGADSEDFQLLQARVERLVRSKGATRLANGAPIANAGAVDEASLPLSEGVLASSQRLVHLFPQLDNAPVHLAVPVTIVGSNWCLTHALLSPYVRLLVHAVLQVCPSDSAFSLLAYPWYTHSEALEAMSNDEADQLVTALRVLCMAIGAGLLFLPGATCAAGRAMGDDDAGDMARARSYLHYLHLEHSQAPEPQVLHYKGLFIPAGWDSKYDLETPLR